MPLAAWTVHVAADNVPDIVESEGKPEANVERKSEPTRPTPCSEERVQKKAMRSAYYTFGADLHCRSPFALLFRGPFRSSLFRDFGVLVNNDYPAALRRWYELPVERPKQHCAGKCAYQNPKLVRSARKQSGQEQKHAELRQVLFHFLAPLNFRNSSRRDPYNCPRRILCFGSAHAAY